MDLTNVTGLPYPIWYAFNELYNSHPPVAPDEFTATQLLKSSKEIHLMREHSDEVVKDVQDVMAMIDGTCRHEVMRRIIENLGDEKYVCERRFSRNINVEVDGVQVPIKISGGVDMYYRDDSGLHIIDYKNTNQASIDKAREGEDTKYLDQMYIYAWLMEPELGERPLDATIVAQNKRLFKKDIDLNDPTKVPAQQMTFSLDDMDYQNALIEKIKGKIENVLSSRIPECSDEEMWMTERLYGVKKPENQKYNKKCSSMAEANQFLIEKGWAGKGYTITEIVPEPKKCNGNCDYLPWCKQGQEAIEKYRESNKENSNG